jgi:hypothetical protein
MSHVRVESIDLDGVLIQTTEIDIINKDAIDDHISFFLRSAVENETKVIGFDIQFSLLSNKNNGYVVASNLHCKRANLSFLWELSYPLVPANEKHMVSHFSSHGAYLQSVSGTL